MYNFFGQAFNYLQFRTLCWNQLVLPHRVLHKVILCLRGIWILQSGSWRREWVSLESKDTLGNSIWNLCNVKHSTWITRGWHLRGWCPLWRMLHQLKLKTRPKLVDSLFGEKFTSKLMRYWLGPFANSQVHLRCIHSTLPNIMHVINQSARDIKEDYRVHLDAW